MKLKPTERSRIAAMLLSAMQEKLYTQAALAERAGVAQSSISEILNQKRRQDSVKMHRTLRSLAGALGKHPTYFEQAMSRPRSPGERMQQARHERGLTLQQIAEQTGMPYPHLWRLERDRLPVVSRHPDWIAGVAGLLDLPVTWQFNVLGEGDAPPAAEEDDDES